MAPPLRGLLLAGHSERGVIPLPVVIEIVDTPEQIDRVVPILDEMVGEGMLTLERVQIVSYRSSDAWRPTATMELVESLCGHLLVASPALLDPNFRRTVVLVTEHTEDGAAGLVLNRPSPVEVVGAVPQLEPVVEDGEQVWVGGPVQPEAVLVLGEFLDPDDAAVPLFGALGFPSLAEPDEIIPATTRRRVFAGYAGWGVGQLESEVADEDWILEPALPDDAFTDDPEELWRDVLRRKGGIYELVARMPEDPRVN